MAPRLFIILIHDYLFVLKCLVIYPTLYFANAYQNMISFSYYYMSLHLSIFILYHGREIFLITFNMGVMVVQK